MERGCHGEGIVADSRRPAKPCQVIIINDVQMCFEVGDNGVGAHQRRSFIAPTVCRRLVGLSL